MHFEWSVDFNHEHLFAAVIHDLEVLEPVDHVVFDSWLIEVLNVELMPQQSGKKFKEAGADVGFEMLATTDLQW